MPCDLRWNCLVTKAIIIPLSREFTNKPGLIVCHRVHYPASQLRSLAMRNYHGLLSGEAWF